MAEERSRRRSRRSRRGAAAAGRRRSGRARRNRPREADDRPGSTIRAGGGSRRSRRSRTQPGGSQGLRTRSRANRTDGVVPTVIPGTVTLRMMRPQDQAMALVSAERRIARRRRT